MSSHPTPTLNVLLLLNLPPSLLCGIDLITFTTSPQFRGFKQIPTGWHFIYTSPTSSLSIRHGSWWESRAHSLENQTGTSWRRVDMKKWNAQHEELVDINNKEEWIRANASLELEWDQLFIPFRQSMTIAAPYNAQRIKETTVSKEALEWHHLSHYIASKLLDRILGNGSGYALNSVSSAPRDVDAIPGLDDEIVRRSIHGGQKDEDQEAQQRPLNFLAIDLKQTWREGAIGRERTEAAQDRSWALGELLRNRGSPFHTDDIPSQNVRDDQEMGEEDMDEGEKQLLGEMQFTFLMIVTLSNYSCMEQWKRILRLVLTCRKAVYTRPRLFVRVLKLLKIQLRHSEAVEGGLFDLREEDVGQGGGGGEGGGAALLKHLLTTFRRGLDSLADDDDDGQENQDRKSHEAAAVKMVRDAYDDLDTFVRTEYGWDLGDSYVRKGMLQLEDGEEVEMEVDDLLGEDERGEYAPVVVDLEDLQS